MLQNEINNKDPPEREGPHFDGYQNGAQDRVVSLRTSTVGRRTRNYLHRFGGGGEHSPVLIVLQAGHLSLWLSCSALFFSPISYVSINVR